MCLCQGSFGVFVLLLSYLEISTCLTLDFADVLSSGECAANDVCERRILDSKMLNAEVLELRPLAWVWALVLFCEQVRLYFGAERGRSWPRRGGWFLDPSPSWGTWSPPPGRRPGIGLLHSFVSKFVLFLRDTRPKRGHAAVDDFWIFHPLRHLEPHWYPSEASDSSLALATSNVCEFSPQCGFAESLAQSCLCIYTLYIDTVFTLLRLFFANSASQNQGATMALHAFARSWSAQPGSPPCGAHRGALILHSVHIINEEN